MTTQAPHAFHGGASFDALGSDFAALERRTGIVDADVLDAWYEPSPRVLATLREHLPWLVKTSPPTHGDGLRAAIAKRHGLAPGHVLVGGGTSALMYQALPRLVRPGDAVALLDPTYGEYRHLCEGVLRARVVTCDLDERDGFRPDPARIADTVRAQNASLLVLVNPNSPTGAALDAGGLRALLALLPATTRVWIDETYVDFAPDVPTAEPLVAADPRVLVAKSMSKFFALSGLRVGYLCGEPRLLAELEPWNPPWSAGLLAQVAAMRALEDYGWYRERAAETRALRAELAARIDALPGLRTFPGAANFVLFATARVPAAELVARCRERSVFLRDCASLSPRLLDRFVRTAVKDRAGNARIAAALAAAL
jgi:histidinol-phosphate/aromatic aminotransferase/cobyric acid decarboxylase-like protein